MKVTDENDKIVTDSDNVRCLYNEQLVKYIPECPMDKATSCTTGCGFYICEEIGGSNNGK